MNKKRFSFKRVFIALLVSLVLIFLAFKLLLIYLNIKNYGFDPSGFIIADKVFCFLSGGEYGSSAGFGTPFPVCSLSSPR